MTLNVTQTNNTSTLLSNLFRDTRGLSNFNVSLTGNSKAFGTFNDSPFSNLGSGVVLSTGKVVELAGVNREDGSFAFPGIDLSTDFGNDGTPGDSLTIQIDFFADKTVNQLSFQSVFGSEEFREYGGSIYKDALSLKLNGVELAKLSDGKPVTINSLVPSPSGTTHPDYIDNPVGTGPASSETRLDGYTKTLTWEGNLQKNAKNTLTINIKDVGDGVYDSAAFIQGSVCSIDRSGTSNNDVLLGTACDDTLKGLNAQDFLDGLAGDDVLDGGDGDDTIYGGDGRDKIWGGSAQDLIDGGDGKDTIDGGDGDDRIWGGKDNDILTGGQGQDKLYGGDGKDTLNGGTGDNLLTGGADKDYFVVSPEGKNTIADFQDGQDRLLLGGGLTFDALNIFQQGSDTVITTLNNQPLAFLSGINSSLINANDFAI